MTNIAEISSTKFAELVEKDPIVFLPIGAVEEHSNHLPLNTDCVQPMHVVEEIAKQRDDVLILPLISYGNCSSTRNFPGTISIGIDTLYNLISDILSELERNNVRKIVVISGHAGRGHMAAIKSACTDVVREHPHLRIMALSDYDIAYDIKDESIFPKNDGHAGCLETSRVWAIRPDLVDSENLPPESNPEFPKYLVEPDPEKRFPSGVMGGNPQDASPERGEKANKFIIQELLRYLDNLEE